MCIRDSFNTPYYLQRAIQVNYASYTAEWQVTGKSSVSEKDVAAYTTYGTVSYTHLDVYKRQMQRCARAICTMTAPTSCAERSLPC